MRTTKSNRTACLVTAGVVALSAFFGCNRSLAALRGDTQLMLSRGDGSGYSVMTDCRHMADTARNLRTVAEKYIPGEQALFDDLEEYCRKLQEGERLDARERKIAVLGIRSVCESVQMKLSETGGLTEKDRGYLAGFEAELDSAMHRMSADPYNAAAERFNHVKDVFPANVLGVFVGPLATFDF